MIFLHSTILYFTPFYDFACLGILIPVVSTNIFKNKNITSPPDPEPSEFVTSDVCFLISFKASSTTHSTSAPKAPASSVFSYLLELPLLRQLFYYCSNTSIFSCHWRNHTNMTLDLHTLISNFSQYPNF